jgi:ABC-2 type transport system ATP-binding protein
MAVIEVSGLRKEFGSLIAVNNINFALGEGQILGLIGPNGAGKTTLLRMLATLLKPTDGYIRLTGLETSTDYLKIRQSLGYLPDFFNLYHDLTIVECLEFFAKAYNVPSNMINDRIVSVLEQTELTDKRDDLIRHLSRGMVQRMGLATLMVRDPVLYLLDEPASGLDPSARIQLRTILKKLSGAGKTIIISSHILPELEDFCTHIAIMDAGKFVTYGAVDDIRKIITGNNLRINISVIGDRQQAVAAIMDFNKNANCTFEDHSIICEMAADNEMLADLNSYLIGRNIKVYSFNTRAAGLEDVFMKITAQTSAGEQGV